MIQFSDVMESNESDARSVEYMQKMYKGCMNEGKENTITGIIGVQNKRLNDSQISHHPTSNIFSYFHRFNKSKRLWLVLG